MKRFFVLVTTLLLLGTAAAAQGLRHHTRPPYSGPKKHKGQGRLLHFNHVRLGAKSDFSTKGKSGHILVR